MTALVIVCSVLFLLGLVVVSVSAPRRSRERRVVDNLRRADQHLSKEFHKARRAMNDAAGQSWRNPFE